MKAGALLDANRSSFGELFPNGRLYQVPPFQRDYSWTEDEWEDLWNDILGLSRDRERHYMGAIVVRDSNDGTFVIIDGQQRIATLSLLALAVLSLIHELQEKGIEPDNNKERFDLLFRQFLGMKDPTSLRSSSRLQLNRQDNGFYQNLINFRPPANLRKLRPSERLLWQGYEYFQRGLREALPGASGSQLSKFLNETVSRGLLFMQIHVGDDQSAYTVFETLNARGLELAPTDLVKNYLFSLAASSASDLEAASEIWARIAGSVRGADFPLFLRHFLASRKPFVRRERLFRAVKEEVPTRDRMFPFLEELERNAVVYSALGDPYDQIWRDFPGAKESLRILVLFGVTQFRPLALAAYHNLTPNKFVKVLETILAISFRFNVISRKGAHQLEQAYNKAAMAVSERVAKSPKQIAGHLAEIYIPDEEFKSNFTFASFQEKSQRKLAAYILLRLEAERTGRETVDFESGDATIEHILPENPADGWDTFSDAERQTFTYRLGNLALLEPQLNRKAASHPFNRKVAFYRQSQFELTRAADKLEWNPEAVQDRQEELAKLATAAWSI